MKKKVIPVIIAIPSLILLFVFKLLPAINSLIISTKNYNAATGVLGSSSVGIRNYTNVIQSHVFLRLWGNTFALSFLSILLTCILATLLIICISQMPNRIVKTISIVIIAIPAFIPIASYLGIIMRALSQDGGIINQILIFLGAEQRLFLAEKQYFSLIFSLTEALRTVYIPVIIGVLACEQKGINLRRVFTVIVIYALVRATMFFSPDLELLHMISNPLVYDKADVLDTYAFRSGLMQMQIASSSAVWVMKTIAQLFVNVLIYFIFYSILPKLKGMVNTLSDRVNRTTGSIVSIVGFIVLAVGSIGVIAGVFVPSVMGEYHATFEAIKLLLSNTYFVSAIFNSFIYCIFSCLLYGFLTITLAYPMTTKSKIYPLFLLLVLTLTNNVAGEYLFLRSLGMINSFFAIILQSGLSVIGAFALHFVVSGKFDENVPNLSEYIKESFLPLISIVGLFFIATWGGYLQQLIFISNRQYFGIGLTMREMMLTREIQALLAYNTPVEVIKSAAILLTSIIPVGLGTLLICLNKVLPLSAFSSQARKG